MLIPDKLQTEIVEYLFKDMEHLPKPATLKNDSPKNEVIATAMAKGVRLGMSRAIEIMNNWNKENKGKVVAHVNSSAKNPQILKDYEKLLSIHQTIDDDFKEI